MLILLVCLGIICSSVCITINNINDKSTISFSPRFSAPEYGNYCYYGGNIFYKSGYGMPNCTAYAWGRIYEILGKTPNLCTGDAGKWFEYNKKNNIYKYGSTPKLGAIACFSNSYGGHVAVVEDIKDDTITFSNSAYGGSNFYLSTANKNASNPGQKGWVFQGYIYTGNYTSDVLYLNSHCRVNSQNGINLRKTAGVNSEIIDTIPFNSQIFVTTTYNIDGYSWGFTHFNGKSGYCVINYTKII